MTTLLVTTPSPSAELDWTCAVIFDNFLEIPYRIEVGNVQHLSISHAGRSIMLPNLFFQAAASDWLGPDTLPVTPLRSWDSRGSGLEPNLLDPVIPVIFGVSPRKHAMRVTDDAISIPIDIFGSVFFMLSRYEEAISQARDAHDRFPDSASMASNEGYLDRPIVDEYVEILWAAMSRLWPGLRRKRHLPRTLVSCDVDSPFDPACSSLYRLGKRLLGRTLRERSIKSMAQVVTNYIGVKRGDYSQDPYRAAIDWIMEVNERADNHVAFYFIPEKTDLKIDGNVVQLDEPRMGSLLRSIHARGHEIGIHPGYNTYQHPAAFASAVTTLRRALTEQGIKQDGLGGRQHYLRWKTSVTARLWEENGLTYDTTLTYSDRPGFRCGTCHEYPMYDVQSRSAMKLRQRPLIMMEAERYLRIADARSPLELMLHYKRICRQFSGDFTLLWHNSYLENARTREQYCQIIEQQ
ncbi:MAG TPA: polysaccharide deacetylase family protein [Telluria sp.]|nr:polysaccharide deacetylase family protein [Telluria sp.]